jgi:putative thioredoxin
LNNAPEDRHCPRDRSGPRPDRTGAAGRERGTPGELSAAVEADPGNHQARFDYAQALHAAGEVEEAIEQLLDLFRRDREWNDGAAKAQLFTIFDALKPTDPIVQKGRRRLSSMIFA